MTKSVVLITGGLTGIGRAAAIAFAKKGARVVVAGRRDEAGNAIEQGRLAATRRAERHDELAGLDTQIDIGKRNVRRRASRTFEGNVQLPDLQTTPRDTCRFGTLCGAGVLT